MRKLFLASFKATTGDQEPFTDQRLIAVDCESWQSEESQWEIGYDLFKEWFAINYPESKLNYIIVHPTISGTITADSAMRTKVNIDNESNRTTTVG